ncbi:MULTISPECIES: hypothetical protein [Tenacibaculum]|uniref:hypothetical protein n=1 Tax=Tenacibaculum TaxID=104267 RepID=UPI0021AFCE96|nr:MULTISPECIES: hypothetical protein [Tenacibaculum]MCT4700154.1 hypothetical protein [Tenacibaculum haliotis]WBX71152.1 hypothetical protein PG912_13235 [Tenacibaculum retecalamus]
MKFLAKNSFIVVFLVVLLVSAILDKVFNIESLGIRIAVSAFFAVLVSPRKKKIQTESGEKTQITWFFLKKPIILD